MRGVPQGLPKMLSKGWPGNPMPWAILLGAVASAWHLVLPEPVLQTVGLMADAASPVALFAIGAVLARAQMLAQQGRALLLRDYLPLAVLKLFVHPLVVLLVGTGAMALGVPLGHDALTVLVLLAALPSASNVSLLAERYGADNGRIARVILVTTVASFLTFSLAVKLVE
jgi:malonate transporter